jgi:hypothetical protein
LELGERRLEGRVFEPHAFRRRGHPGARRSMRLLQTSASSRVDVAASAADRPLLPRLFALSRSPLGAHEGDHLGCGTWALVGHHVTDDASRQKTSGPGIGVWPPTGGVAPGVV